MNIYIFNNNINAKIIYSKIQLLFHYNLILIMHIDIYF